MLAGLSSTYTIEINHCKSFLPLLFTLGRVDDAVNTYEWITMDSLTRTFTFYPPDNSCVDTSTVKIIVGVSGGVTISDEFQLTVSHSSTLITDN